jgi:2-polyprenyl-3-methyl-5-hydroxy-6-metoxy-1,4-benzoquinol methylase
MNLSALAERRLQPELMDQPGLDVIDHARALDGLQRLNTASGVCRRFWRQIAGHFFTSGDTKLKLLDIASGGGDVALGLWALAQRHGVDLEILGLDISDSACTHAARRCRRAGGAIRFQQFDVTENSLPDGFDIVTCSLFLHHLTSAQAVQLLTAMAAAGRLLLLSDLRRCAAGYALAQAACRLATTSPIVRYDGPQSVANAFSLAEMRDLCTAAGLVDAKVHRAWPYRLMIVHEGSRR